ncbi:MAG: CapA family protein [Alistipes sp.]|nr:CapA family protein [Alistipes sp.]
MSNRNNNSFAMKFNGKYSVGVVVALLSVLLCASCKIVNSAPEQCAKPAIDSSAQKPQPPKRLRLLFAGDAMCHLPQIRAAYGRGHSIDFRSSFEGVKSHFDQADIAVVNLETTVSTRPPYSGYPCFVSPTEYIDALAWLGVDVALMANNHCCDNGRKGARETIAKLDTLGIARTGVFHSEEDFLKNAILRIERNGIKLALINYTYGTNGNPKPKGYKVNYINTEQIANDIKAASEDTDCIIACMHWGLEYMHQPSREQRKLAQFLHRNGVDIVVGTHPHVVQPYVATDTLITIYSLGNFISNQKRHNTDGGLLAEIDIEKGEDNVCKYSLRTIPVWVKKPGFRLISSEFAAEAKMSKAQRACYEHFIKDTELILKTGVKH